MIGDRLQQDGEVPGRRLQNSGDAPGRGLRAAPGTRTFPAAKGLAALPKIKARLGAAPWFDGMDSGGADAAGAQISGKVRVD